MPDAEKGLPVATLTGAEKADLFNAACCAHRGPATFICRPCADAQDAVIERIVAERMAQAWEDGARAGHQSPLTWFALRQCNPHTRDTSPAGGES